MSNLACLSGLCVGGVCCESLCDGPCRSCDAALTGAAPGTCAPVSAGTDPGGSCTDDGAPTCAKTGLCEAGACQLHPGPGCDAGPCDDAAECTSGYCVDGVCCSSPCTATCHACSAAKKGSGVDGVCGFVDRGSDPRDDCPDGNGLSCESVSLCDGTGDCAELTELCSPFGCAGSGCIAVCADDHDCAPGFACWRGACVPAASFCQGSIGLAPSGESLDCTPYRCLSDGTCRTSCDSAAECAPDSACDLETERCIEAPPSHGGEAGIACASAPRGVGDGPPVGLLVLLAGIASARRKRMLSRSSPS